MATRFYFLASTTPPVSPAYSASWNSTTGMTRLKMDTVQASTAFTDYSSSSNPFGGGYTGVAQFISRPLDGAQTITASAIRAPILRVKNTSGLADKDLAYIVRVCSNDGLTFRGTVRSFTYTNGADFGASYSSRIGILDTMTSVSASDGDRIVCEVGIRHNSSGAGVNAFEIGDASGSDLGTTAGETNQYNPWFEMGTLTLTFQAEGGSALTQTISNSINSFGPAPSTKWGEGDNYDMTWGTSLWGEGTIDLPLHVEKVITNTPTVTETFAKAVDLVLGSNDVASTFEGSNQTLQDAAGYYYVFTGGVTDSDEQAIATYTEGSAASTSWTVASDNVTSWS